MSTAETNRFSIGPRLKLLRGTMSQIQFAEKVGLSQPALSNYENDRVSPTIEAVISIADACNVSIDWLCGKEPSNPMNTLGDVADFLLDFFRIEEFNCEADIADQAVSESSDNTAETKENRIILSFSSSDVNFNPKLAYSSKICELLHAALELHEQFSNYDCSQDYYDSQRSLLIEQYKKYPVTLMDHTGISDNDLIKLRREKIREEVKRELLKEMKNR